MNPTQHKEQRVGVFVDVQNMYYSAKNLYQSKVDFSKTDFSKELGEESNKLSLKATVSSTHFLYDKNSFNDKALVLLKSEVKKEYQLEKENISYTINNIDKKNNKLIMDAKIKAKAVIKVSGTEIKRAVLGKNQSKLKEILKSQYKIDGYNLTIKEPLPLLKNYLPFLSDAAFSKLARASSFLPSFEYALPRKL